MYINKPIQFNAKTPYKGDIGSNPMIGYYKMLMPTKGLAPLLSFNDSCLQHIGFILEYFLFGIDGIIGYALGI